MKNKAVEKALAELGLSDRFVEYNIPTRTVEEAAQAIGCREEEIAKSLSFLTKEGPILIVMGGRARLDNRKFKDHFKEKAVMIPAEKNEELLGHPAGGITPFGVKKGVRIFFDESLRKLEVLYPAGGTPSSVIRLTGKELTLLSGEWIDVSKE